MNPIFNSKTNHVFNQKKIFNQMYLIPPSQYVKFMKQVYTKFKNSNVPKTLKELKRLALEEARNVSKKIKVKTKRDDEEEILDHEDLVKILQGVYDTLNPTLLKLNNNYKNERRKVYDKDEEYMKAIKNFEKKKIEVIHYILRKFCEIKKISYFTLQKNVLYFIGINDSEVMDLINSFQKLGKSFALPPKSLKEDEVLEILKTYYVNFEYFVNNKEKNNLLKYALVLVNDIIYCTYGLEEEQIYLKIQENNFMEKNPEIQKYVNLIKNLMVENIFDLFDI